MKKLYEIIKIFDYTKVFIILIVIMISFCIFSSIYTVKEGEMIVLRTLGKISYISEPGIHLKFPYPIQDIDIVNVNKINTIEIGFIENLKNRKLKSNNKEEVMLTADKNLICLNVIIEWKINDIYAFLLNAKEPESIYKNAVISSLTSIIGSSPLDSILNGDRVEIQNKIKDTVENIVAKYRIGIKTISIKIYDAQPPNQVLATFQSVSDAEEQKNTLINKAEEYKNQKLPAAEGEAEKIIKEAEAYSEERINKAESEAAKFNSLYNEYRVSKNVTKTRMLIEALEEVLPIANVYIVDDKDGAIKYLPLKLEGDEN